LHFIDFFIAGYVHHQLLQVNGDEQTFAHRDETEFDDTELSSLSQGSHHFVDGWFIFTNFIL